MIRMLSFLLQIALLVAAAVWIAEQEGNVVMQWQDYTIRAHIGLLFSAVLAIIIVSLFLYQIIHGIAVLPKKYRQRKEISNKDKGLEALTKGVEAVAAGDQKAARKHADKARQYLGHKNGLSTFLQAQAARLDGNEAEAKDHYSAMVEDKNVSFLGLRGLLQTALESGNNGEALEIVRKAISRYPRQGWLLETAYDLEIFHGEWQNALDLLPRLDQAEIMPSDEVESDRKVLNVAIADIYARTGYARKAIKLLNGVHTMHPDFVPASVMLARNYIREGKRRNAIKAVEGTWKVQGHPDLVELWAELIPANKSGNKDARLKWFEKLISLNAGSIESYIAAAKEAMAQSRWGTAYEYMMTAFEIRPTKRVCTLIAELEEKRGSSHEIVEDALRHVFDALPDKAWVSANGHIYQGWHWDTPDGFNALEWGEPSYAPSEPVRAKPQGLLG